MFIRDSATQKQLIKTGRKPHVHTKRNSHGFGKRRCLIEGPEGVIKDKEIITKLKRAVDSGNADRAVEELEKLPKKERLRLGKRIQPQIDKLVGRASLDHSDNLESFENIMRFAKNKKNVEIRAALQHYELEMKIVNRVNVRGKVYIPIRRDSEGSIYEVDKKEVRDWIANTVSDRAITESKIRFPQINNEQTEAVVKGYRKVLKIAKLGIKDPEIIEVYQITIEERN